MLAVAAGTLGIAYFAIEDGLGAAVLLASVFTLINGVRLYELIHRARTGAMTREERELFEHVMRIEEPTQQRRLRDLMVWSDVEPGKLLIRQGEVDPPLIYIASGRASIERDGAVVNACGAGEFLGEMSHISGDRASASVTVTHDMRIATLDRDALAQLARSLPEVGKALDGAFNRSLAVKVLRMNDGPEAS